MSLKSNKPCHYQAIQVGTYHNNEMNKVDSYLQERTESCSCETHMSTEANLGLHICSNNKHTTGISSSHNFWNQWESLGGSSDSSSSP